MKIARMLILMSLGVTVWACNKPAEPATPDGQTPPATTSAQAPVGGNGGGIAPMGPNVGGMTPVTGSDSVQGAGGGGVGSAAKDMARRAAANGGAPAGGADMGSEE
ncbi:MAG: hypothetical protein J0H02_09765 [Armatimonadetes bacterium]|nr:hypothetical protein [Armatimonadota bacterium]